MIPGPDERRAVGFGEEPGGGKSLVVHGTEILSRELILKATYPSAPQVHSDDGFVFK